MGIKTSYMYFPLFLIGPLFWSPLRPKLAPKFAVEWLKVAPQTEPLVGRYKGGFALKGL